jgi:DNA-binding GntR family transcriptional regulator
MPLLAEPTPVRTQPAGEEVFRTLRRMILSGQVRPEERLIERHLAGLLNVSRTPVREALRKLEAEGLVRREPYRGLVVARLDTEDLMEIEDIREVLEGLAARLAASRRPRHHLKTLQSLASRLTKACVNDDHETLTRLHGQFHDAIALAAESPRLYGLLATLRDYLECFAAIGYRQVGRSRQACEEHCRIVAHLVAGDAPAAEETARLHIRHSKDALLAVVSHGN